MFPTGGKFFRYWGEEGGKKPSLLFYRLKQFSLFVLERDPHSKTDRTDTIATGEETIVRIQYVSRWILVGIDIGIGILADVITTSSKEVEDIHYEAQLAEITKSEGFLQPHIKHGVGRISPGSIRLGSDRSIAVLSIDAGGEIDTRNRSSPG
jgi:hypothetical protein